MDIMKMLEDMRVQVENNVVNSLVANFVGDVDYGETIVKVFEAFNKRGVSSSTVMGAIMEATKESDKKGSDV